MNRGIKLTTEACGNGILLTLSFSAPPGEKNECLDKIHRILSEKNPKGNARKEITATADIYNEFPEERQVLIVLRSILISGFLQYESLSPIEWHPDTAHSFSIKIRMV